MGGGGGVLIYVRMTISYYQTVSKWGFGEGISPFWPKSSSQVR